MLKTICLYYVDKSLLLFAKKNEKIILKNLIKY